MSPPGVMSPRRPQDDPFASLPSGRPPSQPARNLTFARPTTREGPKQQ
jgi:hypothetical protein